VAQKPKHKQVPPLKEFLTEKKPVMQTMPDWGKFKPAWQVSKLEMCDPFGWHELDKAKLEEILTKLSQFESMTISEIFIRGKYQHHSIPVSKLEPPAKKRLETLNLPDVEELHRLRLSNKERVWGILTQNIIQLLWWDPEHLVCATVGPDN
jgi:hypothetical protein